MFLTFPAPAALHQAKQPIFFWEVFLSVWDRELSMCSLGVTGCHKTFVGWPQDWVWKTFDEYAIAIYLLITRFLG